MPTTANKWRFEAEPDVFQDFHRADAQPHEKISTQPSLGLLTKMFTGDREAGFDQRTWTRLELHVKWLNENSDDTVSYKVLYLTRHGLGYHNKKHAEVGNDKWNNYWSFKDGDGVTTWFDSFLTAEGIQQAKDLNAYWEHLIKLNGVIVPQSLYTSPLARCLQTTDLVFGPLMENHKKPFQPIIKEGLRERWTLHTCDKRRTRSWIARNWPAYRIEDGFQEEDTLGVGAEAETDEEHVARKQKALEEIWDTDASQFVSLTVHSFAIRAIQAVCRTGDFRVREGSTIAMLVKGVREKGEKAVEEDFNEKEGFSEECNEKREFNETGEFNEKMGS